MRRAMRVEYPGSIYDVMDCWESREDILIIGTAKGAESVLHRSSRGQHYHKPERAEEPCTQPPSKSLATQSARQVCEMSVYPDQSIDPGPNVPFVVRRLLVGAGFLAEA